MASDESAAKVDRILSETERVIAELWQEILDTPQLPTATDNFFALGGDSTAMIMVELRIAEELSVELPVGAMLSASTLRELSQIVETQNRLQKVPS